MAKQDISMEDTIALYDKLVASHPDAERKGATVPYTSLNGHMYSYLSKEGVVNLRLPEAAIAPFLEKYKTTLANSYGVVQKEYVAVPGSLLKKTNELKPYFDLSYTHVSLLKPKPASKKKKA